MRKLVVSLLVLGAIGSAAGFAHAQKGLSTGANYRDGSMQAAENARRLEEEQLRRLSISRKAGLAALSSQNFVEAEKQFKELLSYDPTLSDANYLMGLAQMGQKKWDSAKTYLIVAVEKEPKRPDPKARLAVTAIMVNDIPLAQAQRAALVGMKDKCGGCPDAGLIAGNLAMVDKVIAAVNAPPAG
jgi:TolA-binding protein